MLRMTSSADQDLGAPAGSPRRGRGAVVLLVVLGSLAVLVMLGYAATVIAVSGRSVASGTTVRGVQIGGMSTQDAVAALESELGDEATAPIPVRAGDLSTTIDPTEAGLSVDWAATVEQASGLILDPVDLWQHLTGEIEIEPVTTTDPASLRAAVEGIAPEAAVAPQEPAISYSDKGAAQLEQAVPGASLDVPGSADAVSQAYFQPSDGPVALPLDTVDTQVSAQEAQRVFDEVAAPAVALPVTLRVVGQAAAEGDAAQSDAAEADAAPADEVEIRPIDIAGTLTFAVDGATLTPSLSGKKLHRRLADDLADIERPGRDARIVIRSGRPVVVRSRTGLAVPPKDLSASVLAVLPATTASERTAEVALDVSPADFTTADAKALNITEKLSSFRQYFPPAQYRWVNVGQAAEYLNGTIIEPGETFSMNATIKERTPANGYTEGYIISGGRFREDLGGGVSIITTATWTAGFYAGLERVEQHPHGLYISRYQAGLEATVAWGLLDLRMRNDTGNGVLITATRYSDGVVVEMWGTKKFDKVTATFSDRRNYTDYTTIYDDGDKCVPSEGVRGFSISVTRRRFIDGKSVSTETWPTTYRPTPNVVCRPDPAG